MSISVIPGCQSGQRLASLKSAMVSCGEALIWTLRCTIAPLRDGAAEPIGCGRTGHDHRRAPALSTDPPFLRDQQRDGTGRAAGIEPDLPSCHDRSLGGQAGAPALRGFRASAAGSGVAAGSGAASAPLAARCGEHFRSREMLVLGGEQGVSGSRHHRTEAAGSRLYRSRRPRGYFARRPVTRLGSSSVGSSRPAGVLPHCEDPTVRAGAVPSRPSQTSGATVRMRSQMDGSESARIVETRHNRLPPSSAFASGLASERKRLTRRPCRRGRSSSPGRVKTIARSRAHDHASSVPT
jgi:hypothetical protein